MTKQRIALLQKYGLTQEQYQEMFTAQNGVCKICKGTNIRMSLAVDHDHQTGKVRGLLCSGCNMGIGYFRENPEYLIAAVQYLKDSSGGQSCPPLLPFGVIRQ